MPHRMRDIHGGARAVAYLMLAAGPYNFVTGVLLKLGDPLHEVIALGVTSVVLFTVGLICLRRPERMPALFWVTVPFLSAAVITGLNVTTGDTTLGPQLFYLWPLLYAASFLSRRIIALTVVQISAGYALTAFPARIQHQEFLDWLAITVAMAMTALVVASLREHNDKLLQVLELQAGTDALTGAANRRAFDTELGRAVHTATADDPLALVMIDVDRFKTINDTWGHAVGDRALRTVAESLRRAGAGRDHLVARLGGDEFAVVLRAGPYAALRFAELARAQVAEATELPCGPPRISIGIAVIPDHAGNAEELQRSADTALYQAKAGGRGRIMIAQPALRRQHLDPVPAVGPAPLPPDTSVSGDAWGMSSGGSPSDSPSYSR